MPYWSSIVSARSQGYRPQEVWGILTEQFQQGGPAFQGATIFDMNTMWGRAGDLLAAEQQFRSADPANPVTGDMWAWAPWAAPTTAAWQTPNYMLNYAHAALDAEGNVLVDTEGNPVPVWGATDWQGSLDVPAQDVIDRALGSAQSALDTGSPGTLAAFGQVGAAGFGPLLSMQIMRF
jgi:hypothetical protein